jgi:hypothetical protein
MFPFFLYKVIIHDINEYPCRLETWKTNNEGEWTWDLKIRHKGSLDPLLVGGEGLFLVKG